MIKVILSIAVMVSLVFVMFSFGRPYFDHKAFKSDVNETLKQRITKQEVLRKKIFKHVENRGLPVKQEEIFITGDKGEFIVRVSWRVTVDLYGLYQKDLYFEVEGKQ